MLTVYATEAGANLVETITPLLNEITTVITPAQVVEILGKGVAFGVPFFLAMWGARKVVRICVSAISKGKISF